jgi:hypothetical protein
MKAKPRNSGHKTSERMDIRTIARAANVSIATVSRTMNGVATVNPRMAKRVLEVIDEFDYFPKYSGALSGFGSEPDLWPDRFRDHQPLLSGVDPGFEDVAVEHGMQAALVHGQSSKYPPLSGYRMTPEAEVALARSAAPEGISEHATVKVLTASGYKVATAGDNGFACMVMRGWGTFSPVQLRDLVYYAKLRAPICFNPVASRTVLPLQELRARLGMEGKTPDQITEGVQAAYAKGELPKMEMVAFAYMFSADQDLGPQVGHWHCGGRC